ncbi:hypothetical protein [Nocardia sp. CA-119907]|uniref:hypothetical protein n=1 Tax=Nocardia sp. CA-119907 TaxID=3239973 RepID=UPI003D9655C1
MTSTRRSAQWVAAAAIATAATAAASATAHADSTVTTAPDTDSLSAQIMPGVQYTSNLADGSVVIATPLGTLTTRGAQFQVQDAAGATLAGAPVDIAPRAVYSTEPVGPATPTVESATPVADQPQMDPSDRFNQALGVAGGQFSLAAGVGSMIGGVTGLVVGCAAGAVTGGSLFTLVSLATLTVPAALTGCAAGGAMSAAIGVVVGGALVGIPVGIAALAQMQQKLNTPPPTAPTA